MKYNKEDKLSDFSPWLAQYHWYGGDNFIELPGHTSANPNNLLKIVKFHDNVSVYSSLRRPIKISCICSDGKSYSFLVKYGEDLRQDDHIQQIQKLMSDQMKEDKNCSQQKLSIRTYKVIPLTVHCGIISWIDNTETIQSLLARSVPKWNETERIAGMEFQIFIEKSKNTTTISIKENVAAVLYYTPADVSCDTS